MSEYNYPHFKAKYYNFTNFKGPTVGEKAPDFSAFTLEGKRVKLSDYFGRTVVLETGSITCPIYSGEITQMHKLVEEFSECVFLVLYVREAHPGERIGPHHSLEHKLACARKVPSAYQEKRTILVDSLEGSGHTLYGSFPNSVYIINSDGKVAWRSQWNRTTELAENLTRTLNGQPTVPAKKLRIDKPERVNLSALKFGGMKAFKDFLLQFPTLVRHRILKR